MPLGDPDLQPVAPEFRDTWEWGEPDLIVTLEELFTVPPDGPDIYRNFAIDLGLSEDRWLQAMAFHPTAKSAAHHAQFFFDATGESRQLQSQDPEPGFALMSGGVFARELTSLGIPEPFTPAGWLVGWAVGRAGWEVPEAFARHLPGGSDLIVQMHFHPSGKSETERAEVGFYFAEKPGRAFMRVSLPPMFGLFAGIDIPGGVSDYIVEDSFVLPVDVEAFSVEAHAQASGGILRGQPGRTLQSGRGHRGDHRSDGYPPRQGERVERPFTGLEAERAGPDAHAQPGLPAGMNSRFQIARTCLLHPRIVFGFCPSCFPQRAMQDWCG